MNLIKNKLFIYTAIVAFLGFLDATYLSIQRLQNSIPPCNTGGCEKVLLSPYSNLFGVPLSFLGMFFYISVIIVCLMLITNYHKIFLRAYYLFAIWGFLFSLYLIGIQAFIIGAFCQYCLLSAATSSGIFALASIHFYQRKKNKLPLDENPATK